MFYSLYPKSSLATSGKGDWTFKVDGSPKSLSKATYNINLVGRQKELYFNSTTNLEIDLENKKPAITNNRLSIYNKSGELDLFNLSLGISQLVEPELSFYGANFGQTKKSNTKTTKMMFFAGKSTTSPIIGTKINMEYGSNTSYGLFLLNKGDAQTMGLCFSRPLHKFSLFQGECYLDSRNKWGLLLNNSINYKKNSLNVQYSMVNNLPTFKLLDLYKTKRLNTEIEYSIIGQGTLWRVKNDFKDKNFYTGGYIARKKGKDNLSSLALSSFSYSGYAGYNWKLLEKITPSISYSHSSSNSSGLSGKNVVDSIWWTINYLDFESQLSISSRFGVEMTNKQTLNSSKKELEFKRGIDIRYGCYGFKPWFRYDVSNSEDKIQPLYQKESTAMSYGISRNITRNLSLSYSNYQTENKSNLLKNPNNRIQKFLTLDYKVPKLPITLMTKFSWRDKNKPTSYMSITYKTSGKKDTLIKDKDENISYTRQRPIKFGTSTSNIMSLSKEFPDQDKLFQLGRIIIRVFKDIDFDGKFSEKKDIPLKGIKAKLAKAKVEVTTDEDGKASFIDIPRGTYTFSIDLTELPIGVICQNKTEEIIAVDGAQDIYLNFPLVTAGKISGVVFIDKNRNGIFDENENPAESILIYANDIPKYIAPNGKYRFTNLIPGTIKIKVEMKSLPENFEMTTKDNFEVKLLPEQEIKNIDFGLAEKEAEIEFE
ncbi:MAG: SdrD B-like domain-containing protein [bacterium]|nr:SdrD B-like domain-containing protein [bacterium]